VHILLLEKKNWEKNCNEYYERLRKTIEVCARSARFRKPRNRENASAAGQEAAPRHCRVKSQSSNYCVIYTLEKRLESDGSRIQSRYRKQFVKLFNRVYRYR